MTEYIEILLKRFVVDKDQKNFRYKLVDPDLDIVKL